MKPFIVSSLSSICFLLLQACSSAPAQNHTVISSTKIALPDYLEQYIAQHVSSIRRQLNLHKLGYETLGCADSNTKPTELHHCPTDSNSNSYAHTYTIL